jgi:hypothetical protein
MPYPGMAADCLAPCLYWQSIRDKKGTRSRLQGLSLCRITIFSVLRTDVADMGNAFNDDKEVPLLSFLWHLPGIPLHNKLTLQGC